MKLENIQLDDRTERALRLAAKTYSLHAEIKRFVGEANIGYNDGISEVRRIASEGIIEATKQHIESEPKPA
jgi:hypothetical protein